MRKSSRLTPDRLRLIQRRQDPPEWGSSYEPAIQATRDEAPSISRASMTWSNQLGRYCHALSAVEQKVLRFALYHPQLFELHEQRMLSPEPRPHPLEGHELAVNTDLPSLKGTINVCDRLGFMKLHPKISISHPEQFENMTVPWPFIGDFLLFLRDDTGPYCVNWTIKAEAAGFDKAIHKRPKSRSKTADDAVRARHAIEERYYLDAGIPTIRIVDSSIPATLSHNLRCLLGMQQHQIDIDESIYEELCAQLQASFHTAQTPCEIGYPDLTVFEGSQPPGFQ